MKKIKKYAHFKTFIKEKSQEANLLGKLFTFLL